MYTDRRGSQTDLVDLCDLPMLPGFKPRRPDMVIVWSKMRMLLRCIALL